LKGGDGYDTVVVDEAARANPLDLFIPLAKAKRRIILVGDHRQLPHIIDRELEVNWRRCWPQAKTIRPADERDVE